ncbi:MAG: hypothetical protein ACE5Q3_12195 [Alphaproteobacteria bacterium]
MPTPGTFEARSSASHARRPSQPALAALFCALLVISGALPQVRFAFEPANVLPNMDFALGLEHWRLSDDAQTRLEPGRTAELTISQAKPESSLSVTQSLDDPTRFSYLRLDAEIRTEAVAPGAHEWQRARVLLIGVDSAGKSMHDVPHTLVGSTGTTPWRHAEGVYAVRPDMTAMRVSVQLPKIAGTMTVRNLSLRAAWETPWYRPSLLVLRIGSAIAALWAAYLLVGAHGSLWPRTLATAVLLSGVVLSGLPTERVTLVKPLLPGGFLELSAKPPTPADLQIQSSRRSAAPATTDGDEPADRRGMFRPLLDLVESVRSHLRSFGLAVHFAGFFVAATLVVLLSDRNSGARRPAIYLLAAALASETIQIAVIGGLSVNDALDLGVDAAGIISAVILASAYLRRRESRMRQHPA